MQFHQVTGQPHTYIVEDDYGKQLGTVDEFHPRTEPGTIHYIAYRFGWPGWPGMSVSEEKTFPGFTAALLFVESGSSN